MKNHDQVMKVSHVLLFQKVEGYMECHQGCSCEVLCLQEGMGVCGNPLALLLYNQLLSSLVATVTICY